MSSEIFGLILSLLLAPAMLGVINKTKAWFAGRRGAPLIQPYFDLVKLLQKGSVYSSTATWIFKAAPVIILSSSILLIATLPIGGMPSLFSFSGDFLLMAGLLALIRFVAVISSLDVGSSFEGMGASREVLISVLAEPALFLIFSTLLVTTEGASSFAEILDSDLLSIWGSGTGPMLALVSVGLFLLLLAENARIPIDDPETHLELTMVHEVMVLDNSGCDLAYLQYAYALKLWMFASLLVGIVVPFYTSSMVLTLGVYIVGMVTISLIVGTIESSIARLKLLHLPNMLALISVVGVLSVTLSLVVK